MIDQGLGLLRAILPSGDQDDPMIFLPPGQRDRGGFWFPSGYIQPADIFTPAQRRLQAKQRQVQRHRLKRPLTPPPVVSGSARTLAADTTPSRPHAPPGGRPAAQAGSAGVAAQEAEAAGLADRRLPLPAPSPEAPEAAPPRQVPLGHRALQAALPVRSSLPEPERARAMALLPIVDSHKGSE